VALETGVDWVRTEASIYRNPKVLGLLSQPNGWQTAVVYWFSYGYAGENGATGTIPKLALPIIQGTPKIAQRLIDAGLWEVTSEGWKIHDYDLYQPDANYIKMRSEAGRKGAAARWAKRGEAPIKPVEDSPGEPPI